MKKKEKSIIGKIFFLLNKDILYLPVLIIFFLLSSLLDILGIGLVAPYVSIIIDPELVINNDLFQRLYIIFFNEINSKESIIINLGIMLFIVFGLKTLIAIIINYLILYFCFNQGYKLKASLMHRYQNMNFLSFLNHNSSYFVNNVQVVVEKYSIGILQSFFRIISESIVVVAILIFLSFQSIKIVIISIVIFGCSGLFYDFFLKNKVAKYGKETNELQRKIFKNIQEGLEGFKEIRLLGKENFFLENIKFNAKRFAKINSYASNIGLMPRYLIEFLLVTLVVTIVFLSIYSGEDLVSIIPILTMFAVASIRIIPSLNKIFSSVSYIRYGTNFINLLYDDFNNFNEEKYSYNKIFNSNEKKFNNLYIENCSFGYDASNTIIEDLNLEIKSGEFTGIHGESGSGKSTLINILLGLINPSNGKITLNSENITGMSKMLNTIVAYLPQEVFLIDDTIKNNICLGQRENEIDNSKIEECISAVKLEKFVNNLSDGIDTPIGQKGLQISGGQRQRLSLARALYFDREILILDEATNALDEETERQIIQELGILKGKKTVLMISHNIKNLSICDKVYKMENKKLILEENK